MLMMLIRRVSLAPPATSHLAWSVTSEQLNNANFLVGYHGVGAKIKERRLPSYRP